MMPTRKPCASSTRPITAMPKLGGPHRRRR
jgi:hypothetical protein